MVRRLSLFFLAGLLAGPVAAQTSPPGTVPPGYTGPEFRDPKTGQIWTPYNVGRERGPVSPQDRAFNPEAQVVTVRGVVDQQAATQFIATVPMIAGPTVPLVSLDSPTLTVMPGARWQLTIYLNNNATVSYIPVLDCRFLNGERLVEQSRVTMAPVAAGTRLLLTLQGPSSEIYVNSATCGVASL
jgi:hypothetical protein